MTEMTEEMKESRCDVMLRNNWDALFFIFKTQFFSGYIQTVAATKLLYFNIAHFCVESDAVTTITC